MPIVALFFLITGTIGLGLKAFEIDTKINPKIFFSEEYDNDAQLAPKAHLISLSPVPDIQEIAQSHALDAVQAVDINPNWASLLPLDIGFIGFVLNKPTIYRITPIPSTINAIQPFVKLRARHATKKQVRFDIQDDKGAVVFRFERQYKLRIGENLITPPSRMPILLDSPVNGLWKLCLWVNDEPLAEHRFGWETPSGGIVMMPVSQDGEISEELTSEFEAYMDEMSLEELLGNGDQLSQKKN
ncbi:MAG: hypothetical protein SFZ02_01215 [bacterium]|nr:hypothetical protein [bacterium]